MMDSHAYFCFAAIQYGMMYPSAKHALTTMPECQGRVCVYYPALVSISVSLPTYSLAKLIIWGPNSRLTENHSDLIFQNLLLFMV
jgi:hypothetical protein